MKREKLAAFLATLPAAQAARVFAAIEHDRARGGAGLPHDPLLASLRVRLKESEAAFPARPASAKRLFFSLFEDFFVTETGGAKRRGVIARASLDPIFSLIISDPACLAAAQAHHALEAALAAGAPVEASLSALHRAASDGFSALVAHANEDAHFRDDLAGRLGGTQALYDFAEIHLMLVAREPLAALRKRFLKPVAGVSEADIYELREIYAMARAVIPDAAPYMLLALCARMEAPWRAMRVYYHLAAARDGAIGPAADDARIIEESLFETLERLARGMESEADDGFNAEAARASLAYFLEFADGLAAEARRANDLDAVGRIDSLRGLAGDSLARFVELAHGAVRRAMPVRHAGGSSRLRALRPDFTRPLAPQATYAARAASAFLAGAGDLARRLGKPDLSAGAAPEAAAELKRYAGDLVIEIRAAEGEERKSARRLMEQALIVASGLLPADDIALLREKAHAAALSA